MEIICAIDVPHGGVINLNFTSSLHTAPFGPSLGAALKTTRTDKVEHRGRSIHVYRWKK